MREKLQKYLRERRKSGKVFYREKIYSLNMVKDPNPFFNRFFGRNSLIDDILANHDESTILDCMARNAKFTSARFFLDDLERRVAVKGPDFFELMKKHYGMSSFRILRHLLIMRHKISSKIPGLITWNGEEVDLRDHHTQEMVYKEIFNKCPDPLVMRLALGCNYWWKYNKAELDKLVDSIFYVYRYIKGQPRHLTDYSYILGPHTREAVHTFKGTAIYKFLMYAILYTKWLYKKKILIKIPRFLLNKKGEIVWSLFGWNDPFKDISFKKYKKSLEYGILTNPWELLEHCAQFQIVNGGFVTRKKFYFIYECDSLIERLKPGRIFHVKRPDKNG